MLDDIKMWLAGAFLVGMVVPAAVKMSVAAIKKYWGNALDRSLSMDLIGTKDPVLKVKLQKVALAVVEVIEYVVPDRGKGQEKFAKADALLASVPLLAPLPALRKALIEWACEMMWASDDEMKKRLPDGPPPAPPAA